MKVLNFLFGCVLLVSNLVLADSREVEKFKPILEQAESERKAGNYKAAIKLYKNVYLKSEDLDRESLLGLVTTLKEAKRWEDAIEILKLATKRNPFVGEYRIWFAEVYLGAAKFNEAMKEIENAEKILGQMGQTLRIKSSIQYKLGKPKEAIDSLTSYLNNNPKDYNALVDRAEYYFQQKMYVEAFKDLQKAYEIGPSDERVLSSYVRSAFFINNHGEVERVGQNCTKLFPKNIACFEYLGRSAYAKKDFAGAAKFFDSVMALDPSRIDVRQFFAESLFFSGNVAHSDSQFELIFKQRPDYEPAMKSWVSILTQRKNIEMLGAKLKAFRRNNPSNVWAAVELSKLLLYVGDPDSATEVMEETAQSSKSNIAKFYTAYFFDQANKQDKARNMLAKIKDPALEIDFHTGLSFLKDKKLPEAIERWLKVAAESPLYFKAQVNVALALEQQGQIEKAREILSALVAPLEYKKAIEKKLMSLASGEDRKPASGSPDGLSYFTNWSLPQL